MVGFASNSASINSDVVRTKPDSGIAEEIPKTVLNHPSKDSKEMELQTNLALCSRIGECGLELEASESGGSSRTGSGSPSPRNTGVLVEQNGPMGGTITTTATSGRKKTVTLLKDERPAIPVPPPITGPALSIGDLVWAQVFKYCWWPAIVSEFGPEGACWKYMKGKGRKKANDSSQHIRFHVTFLDNHLSNGWPTQLNCIPYEGRSGHDQRMEHALNLVKNRSNKEQDSVRRLFIPNASLKSAWHRSIEIADQLFLLHPANSRLKHLSVKNKVLCLSETPLELEDVKPLFTPKPKKRPSIRLKIRITPKSSAKRVHVVENETDDMPMPKLTRMDGNTSTDFEDKSRKELPIKLKVEEETVRKEGKSKPLTDLTLPEDSLVACLPIASLCFACENAIDEGPVSKCKGVCRRTFDREHAAVNLNPETGLCENCTTGDLRCVICTKTGKATDMLRCCVVNCLKAYHAECVDDFRLADMTPLRRNMNNDRFRCPAHQCGTCLANEKFAAARTGRLITCLHCPISYHLNDECLPAGCEPRTSSYLVCPRHFEQKEASVKQSHVNVDHCLDCLTGGTLVCCERCPVAFHLGCLKMSEAPDIYLCQNCTLGKYPMYDDLLWVKYGNYRWWPAVVLHPLKVPDNVERKRHSVGEFVVRFLGSNDNAYISQGRCFSYEEGDKQDSMSSHGGGSKTMQLQFNKGLIEAEALLKEKSELAILKAAVNRLANAGNIPKYKLLKSNSYAFASKQMPRAFADCDDADYPVCQCTNEHPCDSDDVCANRATQVECRADSCPAGELCQNQRFTKRTYIDGTPFLTANRGWGFRPLLDVKQGTFIGEYCGEIISGDEFRRRLKEKNESKDREFYFLSLDRNRILDAGPAGNFTRFINHSCAPNCETFVWQVGDDWRVGIFALHDIEAGQELTFHYNFDSLDAQGQMNCNCGASGCQGVIQKRKADTAKITQKNGNQPKLPKSKKKRKQTKRKTEGKVQTDNYCFRCWDGGMLMCCDKTPCTRVYHLECLREDKKPAGRWHCPAHYCNDCESPANNLCGRCDNSWCEKHAADKLSPDSDGVTMVCDEVHSSVFSSNDPKVKEETERNPVSAISAVKQEM